MAKKWYKGLTATAVAMAVAGVASMVPAFAEDTVAEPEAEGNKTTEVSTITDAAGNVTTETTTTTTETKEEKDPDFTPTTSKTEDTYVDSTGDIIHTETKIETSETTSEVKKESSTEVSGETVQKGDTHGMMSNPSADWDSLKENDTVTFCDTDFTVQSKVTGEDENGNTTYSVVMTYDILSSEKDSPITQDELSEALGETLIKTGDNTYTYTNAEGKTVTVTVSNDESQEYKKVILNVNVVKDGKTVQGSGEVDTTIMKDSTDEKGQPYAISVTEVLRYARQEGADVTYDEKGRVSTVKKDGTTYSFEYTGDPDKIETVDISGWPKEEILALLGSDYEMVNGEIVDQDGHVLTFEDEQKIANYTTITVTGQTTTGSADNVYGNTKIEAEEEALLAAQKEAVIKAAKDNYSIQVEADQITIKDNKATFTSYEEGAEFVFTFTLSDSSTSVGESTEWTKDYIRKVEKEVKKDIASGQTYTVTGSSTVAEGSVSTSFDYKAFNEEIFLKDGVVTPPDSAEDILADDLNRVTSFTYNGVVYSYVYSDLTDEEREKLIAEMSYDTGRQSMTVTDASKVYKISYTITSTEKVTLEDSETYSDNGAQIVTEGDQIYYVNENEKVLLTKAEGQENVYTGADGKTYTVTEKKLSDEDIRKLVDPDGSKKATVKDGMVTLTKIIDEEETRVTYQYTNSSVDIEIRTETEEESTVQSKTSDKDELKEWISEQLSEAKKNGDHLYIGDDEITNLTVEEVMVYVSQKPDYRQMTSEEVKEYLVKERDEAIAKGDETSSDHLYTYANLHADATLTTPDGETVDCIVIRDDLSYCISDNAGKLADGNGQENADDFYDFIVYGSDYCAFYHEHQDVPAVYGDSYYCVTGKVVYGDYTTCDSETDAKQKVEELIASGKTSAKYAMFLNSNMRVFYRVYEQSADLAAYGYMSASSNKSDSYSIHGYELNLGNLTMTSDGTVVSEGISTSNYSISFTKVHKNISTETVSGDQIILSNGSYDKQTVKPGKIYGGKMTLEISEQLRIKEPAEGNGESSYSLYDTRKTVTEKGKAIDAHYVGDLSYSYKVDKVNTVYRVDDVHEYDADVKEEWNKTVYNYTTKETVTEAVIGHIDSDSNSGGSSSDTDHETSVDSTPETTPDSETIVDPTPSDETPSDSAPAPSIPDDVIDDIIAEVEEEVTPIASVPKTGATENTAAAAASAMALGGIAFALSRKRRRK